MKAITKPALVMILATLGNKSAWSEVYAIPNTDPILTVDIESNSPLFTPTHRANLLARLGQFPQSHLESLKFIQVQKTENDDSFATDPANPIKDKIFFNFSSPTALPNDISFISIGVGLLTYYNNFRDDEKRNWNKLPGRTEKPQVDFARNYISWTANSYEGLSGVLANARASGNKDPIASFLFTMMLFADTATKTFMTYNTNRIPPIKPIHFDMDANSITFSFGPHPNNSSVDLYYKFLLNSDKQIVGVQEQKLPVITLSPVPIPSRFFESATPANPYDFTPYEMDRIRSMLKILSPNQSPFIRTLPLSQRPSSDPPDRYWTVTGSEITMYVDTYEQRLRNPLDINYALSRALGEFYYINRMQDGDKKEWENTFGQNQVDFGVLYHAWVVGSENFMVRAFNAAISGDSLQMRLALFAASFFFDLNSKTTSFHGFDPSGMLLSQPRATLWFDDVITLGDYAFAVRPQDPESGSGPLEVFAIRHGLGEIYSSDNSSLTPFVLPEAFRKRVPH